MLRKENYSQESAKSDVSKALKGFVCDRVLATLQKALFQHTWNE